MTWVNFGSLYNSVSLNGFGFKEGNKEKKYMHLIEIEKLKFKETTEFFFQPINYEDGNRGQAR